MDELQLRIRMAIVGTFIFGFYLVLVKAGLAVGLGIEYVVGGLVAFVALQYWLGTRGVVRQVGAVPLPRSDFEAFYREYERAADEMGFSNPPTLYVAPMGTPNAFAVGRKGKGTVVVSATLLDLLDFDEAGAVVAHELAHLKHRDSVVMVIGESVSTVVGLVVTLLVSVSDSIIVDLVGIVLGMVAKLFVLLFVMALSRYREYAADRAAASVLETGDPLARALAKIHAAGTEERLPANVSALCITAGDGGLLSRLLSTHPPADRRIERLERL